MNINRNNYEEYFLLYIDNELSVAEKNMVEAFVAANPDLGEELVMLQQSIVKPDTVAFPGKEKLIKANQVDAGTEEKLLLLLDNELPEKEKKEILLLTTNNTSVKAAWELLQQTKLPVSDTIIFEDKPSLYRKETKVIPIAWWRMAAAAMLIGFGLWGTVSYLNRDVKKEDSSATAVVPSTKELPSTIIDNTATPVIADDKKKEEIAATTENNNKIVHAQSTGTNNTAKSPTSAPQKKEDNIAVIEEENKKDSKQDDLDNINNDERNKRIIANVSPETNTNKANSSSVEIPSSLKNGLALNTSFSSNSNKEEFETFNDEDDKPRKTKLGGFFKKVKRVIERKTKIKTGSDDELRIANMSFAMH